MMKHRGYLQSFEGETERKGYNIIDSYVDKALTGRTDERPSFQRMINKSKSHAFGYVLVYKLDRFSRSRYDSPLYKKILQDNGVKVISATENIGENPEGIILEAILEGYSEYYSKELAQKITRGNYESRIKGLYTGSKVIYGYRIDENRKYVINEDEANVVRFIFDEALNKKKLIEIVKELNDKGIVYSDGKSNWNINKLSRLLRNEKYIGLARFHESVFDNIVPAIIDDSVFKNAGRLLDRNKHKCKMKSERRFLLSGKIFCGDCGSQMYGYSGTSKTDREYIYYKYKNAIKHNCAAKMTSRD